MFGLNSNSNRNDALAQLDALHKSQAVIEFELDGRIITANENFLGAMGYSLAEVQGQHHRMFVDPVEANSAEYREFWARLNRGEFEAAEFKRLAKGGREIWIEASYNPVTGRDGKPLQGRQVRHRYHRQENQRDGKRRQGRGHRPVAGRDRIQPRRHHRHRQRQLPRTRWAIRWRKMQGKHHGMFVDPVEAATVPNIASSGHASTAANSSAGEYKRIGKGGKEVWIHASYNPILDDSGQAVQGRQIRDRRHRRRN